MQTIAVILPAGKLFDRIFAEAIAPVSAELNAQLNRLSTDLTHLEPTLEALASADSVIADLSGRNPHVMFLTGCARATNKPIVLITQHGEDFPLHKSIDAVIYGCDTQFLRTELKTRLSGQPILLTGGKLDGARDKFLSIFGDLLQKHGYEHRGAIEQNEPNVFTVIEQTMDLPLVQDIARRARELNLRVRLM